MLTNCYCQVFLLQLVLLTRFNVHVLMYFITWTATSEQHALYETCMNAVWYYLEALYTSKLVALALLNSAKLLLCSEM